jgi:ferredoxin
MAANPNFMKPWHGIPREEIRWSPTVVADRCMGCGLCVTSCGREVYAFDYEANVAGYIRQVIRKQKLERQSKDVLKANREKYDIRLHDEVRAE